MPLTPGTLLNNRYRLISILGQGGMGAVYRATDEHLHIPVAVKENLFLTDEFGRQFQREARILAGLRHSNLPHVTDYFAMENQVQYLVMDFIEGEDLRQRMERMGTLPERETVLIGISICDALTYLHTRHPPIVHRDIKPGNIKVTSEGQAVLVDFGLAKIMQGSQVTSTGARAMTPGYSPPEQYGTARTDPRSDIYSLGATLYAALTGVIPEDGLGRMTGKTKLTPIRDLAPKTSRKLAEVVECALELDAENRHQTAEEFKQALVESGELALYYQDRPVISPPPSDNQSSEGSEIISDNGPAEEMPKSREWVSRRRRKQRTKRLVVLSTPLVLVAVAFLFAALRPDLAHAVLSNFSVTPTASSQAQIDALFTSGPTPSTSTITATLNPAALQNDPIEPTVTPSPEPILAQTPTITLTATPTVTPPGGGMGEIAFSSNRSGPMQVWLMDVATKKAHPITNMKDGACQPTWAPDGLKLAFISPCAGRLDTYQGANIYTIDVDAEGNPDKTSVKQITSNLEGDFDPAWSPDGSRIAYTSLRNGVAAIYMINLDEKDSQPRVLFQSQYSAKQPAWNPNGGMQLAFVWQYVNSQIWVITDSGQYEQIISLKGPVNNLWPAWSRDGSIIFYSQSSSGSPPILVYRKYEDRSSASPVENRIPTNPKTDVGPEARVNPSPDGFWLAYESWPDGKNYDIYMMNSNGSNQERLTTDPGVDFSPVWRPLAQPLDGSQ